MIDTDKYDGHTPGPWEWHGDYITEAYGDGSYIAKMEYDYKAKDARLIEDTPLLLAEVIRLREDNKKLHDAIDRCAYRGREGSAYDLYIESIIQHVGEECEEE
jgi:hypothetical protein